MLKRHRQLFDHIKYTVDHLLRKALCIVAFVVLARGNVHGLHEVGNYVVQFLAGASCMCVPFLFDRLYLFP